MCSGAKKVRKIGTTVSTSFDTGTSTMLLDWNHNQPLNGRLGDTTMKFILEGAGKLIIVTLSRIDLWPWKGPILMVNYSTLLRHCLGSPRHGVLGQFSWQEPMLRGLNSPWLDGWTFVVSQPCSCPSCTALFSCPSSRCWKRSVMTANDIPRLTVTARLMSLGPSDN